MIFTEEEAKKIRCLNWVRGIDGCLVNCIASGCMAWRWVSDVTIIPNPHKDPPGCFYPDKSVFKKSNRGYCGRAGKADW